MKKILLLLCGTIILISLSACEPKVTGIKIVDYPNKLMYVQGVDSELDLDGGRVKLTTNDILFDTEYYDDFSEYSENEELDKNGNVHYGIIHEIDFNTPGVYEVTINRYDYIATFAIQVVSPDELLSLVNE